MKRKFVSALKHIAADLLEMLVNDARYWYLTWPWTLKVSNI